MAELIDSSDLDRWIKACQTAPAQARDAMRMAINDAGNFARTRVIRTLASQMGVPVSTVRQSLTTRPAWRELVYELASAGGFLSLASFDAQQRRAGVSARPWGRRRIFRGTFIVPRLGGQVFRRTTRARFPIVKLWGPSMPQELVRDRVPAVFETEANNRLPVRLAHHMNRLFSDDT
jgi:hypothetical protein